MKKIDNYPIPYPSRVHINYKYRSVSGVDMPCEAFGRKGESKDEVIERIKEDHKDSVTPVSVIDGVPMDLNEFLQREIRETEQAIRKMKDNLILLKIELSRRSSELEQSKRMSSSS